MRGGMQLCGSQTPNGEVWNQQWEGGKAADNSWGRGRRGPGWACATGNHTCQHRCCVLCAKPSSLTLPGGWICVRSRPVRCGLVCEFSKALAHVHFSLSPEHTASIQEESDLKPAVLALLQEAVCDSGLPQICWFQPDFSACFSQSLRSESLLRFFFFPHSTEMWNTPTIFHTIWEVQRFFSNLCRHW